MVYISREGNQTGPFSEEAIIAGLREGSLEPSDFAWQEGWPEWQPLSFLYPSIVPPRPPAPPAALHSPAINTPVSTTKSGITPWKVAAAVVSALLLLYLVSPYWATFQLFSALKAGDAAALKQRIDFPELRENLKEQLKASMMRDTKNQMNAAANQDDAAAALGTGIAALIGPALIDGLVDNFVTPSGLAGLLSVQEGTSTSGDAKVPGFSWAFFSGPTEFKITSGNDASLYLHFKDFGWQLYRMSWPEDAHGLNSIALDAPTNTSQPSPPDDHAAAKRTAQNLASLASSAAAVGVTKPSVQEWVTALSNGITVTVDEQSVRFVADFPLSDPDYLQHLECVDGNLRYSP